ncbi:peptidase T [Ruminococcaceae bacterium OttesenSCG-928-L11]|nr:peptidase T [Ruminococcaceae bacterium OttesenSCG-928-L11]
MKAHERMLRYIHFPTVSDAAANTCPSTPAQLDLGRALVQEMLDMGIADANMDENGYVFGTLPANNGKETPVLGFIAHMDVSDDAPSQHIKTRVVPQYDGGPIVLNEKENIVMDPTRFPVLSDYTGHDLIVTDGTTLMGCDDKAGIAEILTMAEYFLTHPDIPHGTIKIGFTPDEEIGRGADLFDVKQFGADFAYTVDGGAFGEVTCETFNAASATVIFTGKSMHPGAAKDKLVNASLLAMEFHAMLPPAQRPEHTQGYEGFYHLTDMVGRVEQSTLSYIVRDHDLDKLEAKKAFLQSICDFMNAKYGEGTVRLDMVDSYYNMSVKLKDHWHLIDTARAAVEKMGGTPCSVPVRGGTDGSRLSFMGLPCPNLGTGSHNHHSRTEFASIQAMEQCTELLIAIAQAYGG